MTGTECTLTPIPLGSIRADNDPMVQVTIRCHPCVPVASDDLKRWLEEQVSDLRARAPAGTLRVSHVTQGLPSADLDNGWLLEIELSDGHSALASDRFAEMLRDMRLLGLQPMVLVPAGPCDEHAPVASGPDRRVERGPDIGLNAVYWKEIT